MMPERPTHLIDVNDLRAADDAPEPPMVRRWFCESTDRTFVVGFAWCRGDGISHAPSIHLGLGFWAIGVEWLVDI